MTTAFAEAPIMNDSIELVYEAEARGLQKLNAAGITHES